MGPLPMRVEWRCALTTHTAQSVMTHGMNLMPKSYADSWDITSSVSYQHKNHVYSRVYASACFLPVAPAEIW